MAEYNPSKIIKDGNTYNFRDTTKIPLAGSNAISGSLIPATTDAYDLGGSSYQWNNAYIKSLTINGVAWGLDKANTWSNVNAYSREIRLNGDRNAYISPMWSGTGSGISFLVLDASKAISFGVYTNDTNNDNRKIVDDTKGHIVVFVGSKDDVNYAELGPRGGGNARLGTSSNKWTSFNGINPGALSLPGTSVNVDTTNWVLDGSVVNVFTPASDGWLGIQVIDTVYDQMHYVFVGRITGGSTYYQQNVLSPINTLWDTKYHGCVFIPVVKNKTYHIRCICDSIAATFYSCQGNV